MAKNILYFLVLSTVYLSNLSAACKDMDIQDVEYNSGSISKKLEDLVLDQKSKDEVSAIFTNWTHHLDDNVRAAAARDLGYKYYSIKKFDRSFEWVKMAADFNDPSALYNAFHMLYQGIGIEKNEKEALNYRKILYIRYPDLQEYEKSCDNYYGYKINYENFSLCTDEDYYIPYNMCATFDLENPLNKNLNSLYTSGLINCISLIIYCEDKYGRCVSMSHIPGDLLDKESNKLAIGENLECLKTTFGKNSRVTIIYSDDVEKKRDLYKLLQQEIFKHFNLSPEELKSGGAMVLTKNGEIKTSGLPKKKCSRISPQSVNLFDRCAGIILED